MHHTYIHRKAATSATPVYSHSQETTDQITLEKHYPTNRSTYLGEDEHVVGKGRARLRQEGHQVRSRGGSLVGVPSGGPLSRLRRSGLDHLRHHLVQQLLGIHSQNTCMRSTCVHGIRTSEVMCTHKRADGDVTDTLGKEKLKIGGILLTMRDQVDNLRKVFAGVSETNSFLTSTVSRDGLAATK